MFAPVSREGALVLNNILLCSIVRGGVRPAPIYPLFADLLFGEQLSVGAALSSTLTVLPLLVPLFRR